MIKLSEITYYLCVRNSIVVDNKSNRAYIVAVSNPLGFDTSLGNSYWYKSCKGNPRFRLGYRNEKVENG